jgi:hypothetical protein
LKSRGEGIYTDLKSHAPIKVGTFNANQYSSIKGFWEAKPQLWSSEGEIEAGKPQILKYAVWEPY